LSTNIQLLYQLHRTIRNITLFPAKVFYWTQEQCDLYNASTRHISVDATGGVAQKITRYFHAAVSLAG
jgi:hypothetical protein